MGRKLGIRGGLIIGVIAALIVAVAIGAYYYVSTAIPSAPVEILIGATLPMTGGSAPLGEQAKAAIDIWLEDVNGKGGLFVKEFNKRIPVRIMLLDDQSTPSIAAQNVERLVKEGAVVIYGPSGTVYALAAAPAAERNKIPMVTIQTSTVMLTRRGFKYVFAGYKSFLDDFPTLFNMIESIPPEKRPKTFAMITDNTAFGKESMRWFVEVAKQRGYADKIVLLENVTARQPDFTASILKLKRVNPDVLIDTIFFHSDVYNFYRQMKANDYYPKMYVGWTAPSVGAVWTKTLGKDGDYVVLIHASWHPSLPFPGSKELAEKYKKRFGREPTPDVGLDYAILQVIGAAIENAGALDREKIRDALQNIDVMTVLGPVRFQKPGSSDPGRIIQQPFVTQYQNMQSVIIWPKEYATGELIYPAPSWKERG